MSSRTGEWAVLNVEDDPKLPPDLTYDMHRTACWVESDHGMICTRAQGHTGRHAAGDTRYIREVWL